MLFIQYKNIILTACIYILKNILRKDISKRGEEKRKIYSQSRGTPKNRNPKFVCLMLVFISASRWCFAFTVTFDLIK